MSYTEVKGLVYPAHELFEPYHKLARDVPLKQFRHGYGKGEPGVHHDISLDTIGFETLVKLGYAGEGWTVATMPNWVTPDHALEAFWRNFALTTIHSQKNLTPYILRDGSPRIFNHGLRIGRWGGQVGHTPTAYEMLAYGTGTLFDASKGPRGIHFDPKTGERLLTLGEFSAQNPKEGTMLKELLGVLDEDDEKPNEYFRIGSELCTSVTDQYEVDDVNDDPMFLETKPLVMPEVLGELEQLQSRRKNTKLLNAYLLDLQGIFKLEDYRRQSWEKKDQNFQVPAALNNFPMKTKWCKAYTGHLQSGMYKELPQDIDDLRARVERLLSLITIDTAPILQPFRPW